MLVRNNYFSLVAVVRESGRWHTRIACCPSFFSTDSRDRFRVAFRYFPRGEAAPAWEAETDTFPFQENRFVEVADLLRHRGERAADGLLEVLAYSLEREAAIPVHLEPWVHLYDDERRVDAALPCAVYRGSFAKPVVSGNFQAVPGIVATARHRSILVLMNFHPRPVTCRARVYRPDGGWTESDPVIANAFDYRWDGLQDLVPDLQAFLAPAGGLGTLRVEAQYRIPVELLIEDRVRGVMTSLEHSLPLIRSVI